MWHLSLKPRNFSGPFQNPIILHPPLCTCLFLIKKKKSPSKFFFLQIFKVRIRCVLLLYVSFYFVLVICLPSALPWGPCSPLTGSLASRHPAAMSCVFCYPLFLHSIKISSPAMIPLLVSWPHIPVHTFTYTLCVILNLNYTCESSCGICPSLAYFT